MTTFTTDTTPDHAGYGNIDLPLVVADNAIRCGICSKVIVDKGSTAMLQVMDAITTHIDHYKEVDARRHRVAAEEGGVVVPLARRGATVVPIDKKKLQRHFTGRTDQRRG